MNNQIELAKILAQSATRRGAMGWPPIVGLAVIAASRFALSPAVAGVFHATGPMTTARHSHTATLLLSGKVLVIGGYDANDLEVASAELYDPATGAWTRTGALKAARGSHTATLLPSGKVVVAGGGVGNPWGPIAGAEIYNPATETWTETGAMRTSRSGHTATLLPNGKVLVAGGDGTNDYPVASTELYDPATGTWTETGALNEARWLHTATLLGDGKVLVVAGYAFGAELFDPATGTWSPAGDYSDAPNYHTATLLPSGQVLVAGGFEYGTFGNYYGSSYAELFAPASPTWTYASDLNIGRGGQTATLLYAGKVLVTGGSRNTTFGGMEVASAEEYDPITELWTLSGEMTVPRCFHTATLLADGQVLVAGGGSSHGGEWVGMASAELYDARSVGSWLPAESLHLARLDHTATLLTNGQVLVAGGYDWSAGPHYLSSVERYERPVGTWVESSGMLDPRARHTATRLQNGQVLVAGGTFDGSYSLFGSELYDPVTKGWTATGGLNEARGWHTATLLTNGQVLVAGGSDYGPNVLGSAELYDSATGTWTWTGGLNAPRDSHTAILLPNGKVLIAGGEYFDGAAWVPLADAELYDPASGIWTVTGSMRTTHLGHTATLLPNGRVLLAGGTTNALFSAELYDPVTETWTATNPMGANRAGHTATLLTNGLVLVAGGGDGSLLNSAELYDSASGLWTPAAPLNTGRFRHTAVLLADGHVLAAGGGSDSAPYYLASSELYEYRNVSIPRPTTLTSVNILANGSFQFSFTNTPGGIFHVLATTLPTLPPSEWMVLGGVTEISSGQFQFTDSQATNYAHRFYRLRSP